MKRAYIFFVILFTAVAQMEAQQVAVAFKDGAEVMFEESYLSSKITFLNGKMLFHVDGVVKNAIDIKEINRIYFYDVNAHIDEMPNKDVVAYSAVTEELGIHAQPGTAVALYHTNGSLVLSRVQTIASAPISLAHLPAGVYMVVVGSKTLKFVKQ